MRGAVINPSSRMSYLPLGRSIHSFIFHYCSFGSSAFEAFWLQLVAVVLEECTAEWGCAVAHGPLKDLENLQSSLLQLWLPEAEILAFHLLNLCSLCYFRGSLIFTRFTDPDSLNFPRMTFPLVWYSYWELLLNNNTVIQLLLSS